MPDKNTQSIIDAVSACLAGRAADTPIADLGCGEGGLLSRLAENGFSNLTGIGYDIKPASHANIVSGIDLCSENWAARAGSERYDIAAATEVIEHLTNPFLFLCEARKLLAEGGELILTFPNVHNWRSIAGYALCGRFSGFFGPNFNDGHPLHDQHIFIPNMHLIRYLLNTAGFSVVSEQPVNGRGRLFAQTMLVIAKRHA